MLTHANHSWPRYKSFDLISKKTYILKIKKETNNYLYKFFLVLDKQANLLAFFLQRFSYAWISETM